MFKINVKSGGLKRAIAALPGAFKKHILDGTNRSTIEVQRIARASHRFKSRSGALERSVAIGVEKGGLSGKVYLDTGIAKYGPSIHGGHGTWAADQFLYAAADKTQVKVKNIIEDAIAKAIKAAGF